MSAPRLASLSMIVFAIPLLAARGCEEPGDPGTCYCTEEYAPVCGSDGVTYSNACHADCSGVMIAHDGECGASCVCPALYAPVCGTDGRTYGNDCEAACAGQMVVHEGECETACACPEIYAPVCGWDGITYGNECEAHCAGMMVQHPGACECPGAPLVMCEWGYVTDERGCPTPECLPPPSCEPVLCDVYCEHGHVVDERGCEICACNPPPPTTCFADDECGMGSYCDLEVCRSVCDPMSPDGAGCPAVCAGECRPIPPPPSECWSDSDCAMGEYCALPACGDGMSAGPGVCIAWEPPPPPPPPSDVCRTDSDCPMGGRCELPVCIWEGTPDSPCPTEGVCVYDGGEAPPRI